MENEDMEIDDVAERAMEKQFLPWHGLVGIGIGVLIGLVGAYLHNC